MIFCKPGGAIVQKKMIFFDEISRGFGEKLVKNVKVRVRFDQTLIKRTFQRAKTVKNVKVRVRT